MLSIALIHALYPHRQQALIHTNLTIICEVIEALDQKINLGKKNMIALMVETHYRSGEIKVLTKMKMILSIEFLMVDVFVLAGFDLLEEFRVPELRGVRRVDGSGPVAAAYRVNPSIHLRRRMRYRGET